MRNMDRTSGWQAKFKNALRGLWIVPRGQNSFLIHFPVAILVIGCAIGFQVTAIEFSILLLCTGAVLTTEYLNRSLELMARAITNEENEWIRNALDAAAGAVLLISLTAMVVGTIILLPYVWPA